MLTAWDFERLALRKVLSLKRANHGVDEPPVSAWAANQVVDPETILIGDSLIRRMPSASSAALSMNAVVNHGWGGQTTVQVLRRLEVSLARLPSALVIQVGTNDLLQGTHVEFVAASYRQLTLGARDKLPEQLLVVCALPPMARWRCDPRQVRAMNEALRETSALVDARFADVFAALSSVQDTPLPGRCTDGVHLSDSGYRDYVSVLQQILS